MARIENRNGVDIVFIGREELDKSTHEGFYDRLFVATGGFFTLRCDHESYGVGLGVILPAMGYVSDKDYCVIILEEKYRLMGKFGDAIVEHEIAHCVNRDLHGEIETGDGILTAIEAELRADAYSAMSYGKETMRRALKRALLIAVYPRMSKAANKISLRDLMRKVMTDGDFKKRLDALV